jgi:hypothetical protein
VAFIGHGARGCPGARQGNRGSGAQAVSAMDTPGQGLGSDGLPRANNRAGEMGRVYGLSPERKGIGFFFYFRIYF